MNKVSILIPVYNVKEYINRCLESVVIQTAKESIECIIVDDCGTDGSITVVEDFIMRYKGDIQFRIIHHDHNRGLAAARNTAVAAAKGDFVFHLDSDDWLEPDAIELLVKKQVETDADIVSGNALRHSNDGEDIMTEPKYASNMEMVHNTIEMTLDHVIWRRLIRKSLYTDNNIAAIEGVNVGEDHHTLPRLAYYAKKVVTLDKVVYHYNCMNPNSYMSQASEKINIKRYQSDLASIGILQNFFIGKDAFCEVRLKEMRMEFLKYKLYESCMLNDRTAYNIISKDASFSLPYHLWWLRVKAGMLKKRILG